MAILGQANKPEEQESTLSKLSRAFQGIGAGLQQMGGDPRAAQYLQAQELQQQQDLERKQMMLDAAKEKEYKREFEREKFEWQKTIKEKELGLRKEAQKIKKMKAKKDGLRPLNAPQVLKVNEGNAIPVTLNRINELITEKQSMFDPIMGRARKVNPYDEEAQVLDAEMRAASQQFGRFMEGGVLRKEDEEKYRKMFPSISDTPGVAKGKLAAVQRMLSRKQKSDLSALKKQGFDTTGLELPKFNLNDAVQTAPARGGVMARTIDTMADSIIPSAQAATPSMDYDKMSDEELTRLYNQRMGIK